MVCQYTKFLTGDILKFSDRKVFTSIHQWSVPMLPLESQPLPEQCGFTNYVNTRTCIYLYVLVTIGTISSDLISEVS